MPALPYSLGICRSPLDKPAPAAADFDFFEVNVQQFLLPEQSDADFQRHREAARNAIRPVATANCFLPGDLRCVGDNLDWPRLLRYAETAFRRGREIGLSIIVFGSGTARSVPEGYDRERAADDFIRVLKRFAPLAEDSGITLVVEPLNRQECNLITSLQEGAEMVERCQHPSVRLLADCYHMMVEGEPASEIVRFRQHLHHIHFAEQAGRAFPGRSGEDFRPWFGALAQIGYSGRLVLECAWDHLPAELPVSAEYLRQQAAG